MPRPKTKDEFVRNLKVLYDSFEFKDMTWPEFLKGMIDMMDPKKVMSDLGDIELRKARERMNKIRIDNARK